jgi:hypothetical protein
MPLLPPLACLLAATETLRQRLTSRLLDDFSAWWHAPALGLGLAAVATAAVWILRRDAAGLRAGPRSLLTILRLGAVAAVVAALFDVQRFDEHEIVVPSRVAVLVDASASMALVDGTAAATEAAAIPRARRALDVLDDGGLLAALQARHDVAVWRFAADARRLVALPTGQGGDDGDWRPLVEPVGAETRLGEAFARVLEEEPADALAGIVVLTDGASTGGIDPRSAARPLAEVGVPVHAIGIGSDTTTASVRVADVAAPTRVFPGDRFTVTAYLQSQGLAGRRIRVELSETATAAGSERLVGDVREAELGADGELVPVAFEVTGLGGAGRRSLVVRVEPPATDREPGDDARAFEIEVVDRITRVLLLAGGPSREYQFMRAVLDRDRSFAADVLLGTTPAGEAAARPMLGAFPETDEALAEYDAVVAFDWDWRTLDEAAQGRLERWVAHESGGVVLVAGGIFMESWLADRRPGPVRGLFPIDLRRTALGEPGAAEAATPRPLRLSHEGLEAEFLRLSTDPAASAAAWESFPGFFAGFASGPPKPGATVYARLDAGDPATAVEPPVAMAGQFYGSGTVFYVGSGELWRLRAVDAGLHERLVAQIVRHVAQGRLLRGSRRGRLVVDRDRVAVGTTVAVRLVLPETGRDAATAPAATAVGPDGATVPVPLAAEPGRPDVLGGRFVAAREGAWEIRVGLPEPDADEPLVRRVHAQLPDLETARPRLDRGLLEEVAATTGGGARFLADAAWTPEAARELAAAIPDRTRREYVSGAPDSRFKQRLNTVLLSSAVGLLCLEWALRRLLTLA